MHKKKIWEVQASYENNLYGSDLFSKKIVRYQSDLYDVMRLLTRFQSAVNNLYYSMSNFIILGPSYC